MNAFPSMAGGEPPFYGTALSADSSADPVEHYFECISTCSLDDGECVTACVEVLRENP